MDTEYRFTQETAGFTFSALIGLLIRQRWLVIGVTAVCVIVAGAIAFLTPKTYEASIIVSAVSTTPGSQGGGLGGLTSQLGGLAALAGLSVGSDSKKAESIAVLQSEALTEAYIRDKNLLPVLFSKRWDPARHSWKVSATKEIPTPWEANRYFKKEIRTVVTDSKTGLVTLTIAWRDPKEAATWANDLVGLANDYLRNKAIVQGERNIAYLTAEAEKTNVVEAKQAIYSILQSEINKVMLARGSEEYAFRIVDPAVIPEKASYPLKTVWVIAGFIVGIMLSCVIGLARESHAGQGPSANQRSER